MHDFNEQPGLPEPKLIPMTCPAINCNLCHWNEKDHQIKHQGDCQSVKDIIQNCLHLLFLHNRNFHKWSRRLNFFLARPRRILDKHSPFQPHTFDRKECSVHCGLRKNYIGLFRSLLLYFNHWLHDYCLLLFFSHCFILIVIYILRKNHFLVNTLTRFAVDK